MKPLNNKPIKVLVVDDERKACANLTKLLTEYIDTGIHIAGVAYDTSEAEAQIVKHTPDAVFLDIEMPNENAFHFLERVGRRDFEVIFVTAYDEYAIRAFKLNALDYILKPISIAELKNAYSKLKDKIRYKKLVEQRDVSYIELANQVSNKVKHERIVLKDISSTEMVDFKSIYFVEAQGSYSRIVFFKEDTLKEMTLSSPLSDYEELLPTDHFFRIHRSYLINCEHIKKIMNDGSSQLIMNDGQIIPVSRRRFAALISFLESHEYL